MSPMPAARGRRHALRARLTLWAGGLILLAATVLVFLLRPDPVPYTPGVEAESSDEITRSLSRSLPGDAPAVTFTDAARQAGLDFRHFQGERSTQLPEDMGSGLAWGDYDGDGDPDLFLVNESGPLGVSRPSVRSALYRNDAGRFVDVTEETGLSVGGLGMGAAWGDYDGDADLDLVVTRYGTNVLYRNESGRFSDATSESGLGGIEGFWTGASWADYDRDGDLDLYIAGYVRYRHDAQDAGKSSYQYGAVLPYTLNPSSYPPERNILWRNDGGRFTDASLDAGVINDTGRSLSASWCDFDSDGWPDLYVANDISDNALFMNRGDGTFADESHSAWVADYRGAMGLGVADWEGDGDLDIFVTHWIAQENAFYENLADRMPPSETERAHFIDQADLYGLGQIALDYVGWGTGFFDYDNDGRLDLFVANGSTLPVDGDPTRLVPMVNLLFWNGGERGFFETGSAAGDSFSLANVGRGSGFADYDMDGDLDVAVLVNGGDARLLRNDLASENHWLRLVLRGSRRTSPEAGAERTTSHASGARVRLVTGERAQIREIGCGSSYLSQDPPGEAHFGLGSADSIDRLEITWPGGSTQSFDGIPIDTTVLIVEGTDPRAVPTAVASTEIGKKTSDREEVLEFWRLFRQATASRLDGDHTTALEAYEAALAIDPAHEDSLYYLGQCQLELGHSAEAEAAFLRLLEINPRSFRGHVSLGSLLAIPEPSRPADLERAEEHLREAHAINAEQTGAMVRLGEILLLRGRTDEASHWLEAAGASNPRSVEAHCLAGYLRWRAGDREAALRFRQLAIRASQGEKPVHGVLGEGDRKPGTALRRDDDGILGSFCEHLEQDGAGSDLEQLYGALDRYVAARQAGTLQ